MPRVRAAAGLFIEVCDGDDAHAPVGDRRRHVQRTQEIGTPAEFAFMIGDGKFVRYGSDSAKVAAPGGGKVGMTTQELQALYHGALQSTPHKYVEGGQYLSMLASGVAPAKLVFEVDAAGKASAWRVGLSPQVDYVEGCS